MLKKVVLITGLILTLTSVIILARMKKHTVLSPLDKAADRIGEVTNEAKTMLEEAFSEIRLRMPGVTSDRLQDLNRIASETRAKFDTFASEVRSGLRKVCG